MSKFNATMKLDAKAERVMKSLRAGRQPAKSTPKWVIEGLEHAGLISWRFVADERGGLSIEAKLTK